LNTGQATWLNTGLGEANPGVQLISKYAHVPILEWPCLLYGVFNLPPKLPQTSLRGGSCMIQCLYKVKRYAHRKGDEQMNKPLPKFHKATPNRPKAEVKKPPKGKKPTNAESRKVLTAHVLEVHSKVLEVIADQHGKATWNELRKRACKDQRILGLALKALMDAGRVKGPTKEYPGWESTALYRLVVVKGQKAA